VAAREVWEALLECSWRDFARSEPFDKPHGSVIGVQEPPDKQHDSAIDMAEPPDKQDGSVIDVSEAPDKRGGSAIGVPEASNKQDGSAIEVWEAPDKQDDSAIDVSEPPNKQDSSAIDVTEAPNKQDDSAIEVPKAPNKQDDSAIDVPEAPNKQDGSAMGRQEMPGKGELFAAAPKQAWAGSLEQALPERGLRHGRKLGQFGKATEVSVLIDASAKSQKSMLASSRLSAMAPTSGGIARKARPGSSSRSTHDENRMLRVGERQAVDDQHRRSGAEHQGVLGVRKRLHGSQVRAWRCLIWC
jgi:hypothetical protein